MAAYTDLAALEAGVRKAVAEVTITDIHTHLFPPSHGELLLWGVDEVLTYHYLVAELFTMAPAGLTPEKFWKLPKREQADLVWNNVFLKHGALSEACRGVITTMNELGLDIAGRDLASIRKWFDAQKIEEYLPKVFQIAGLDYAVMTNNPFVAEEAKHWKARKATGDAWVLPSPSDPSQPCSRHLFRDWWLRGVKAAGLEEVEQRGWHSLRRLFGTRNMGLPDKLQMALGGWKDMETVRKCYQEVTFEDMKEALAG